MCAGFPVEKEITWTSRPSTRAIRQGAPGAKLVLWVVQLTLWVAGLTGAMGSVAYSSNSGRVCESPAMSAGVGEELRCGAREGELALANTEDWDDDEEVGRHSSVAAASATYGSPVRKGSKWELIEPGHVKRFGEHDYLMLQRLRWIGGGTMDDHRFHTHRLGLPGGSKDLSPVTFDNFIPLNTQLELPPLQLPPPRLQRLDTLPAAINDAGALVQRAGWTSNEINDEPSGENTLVQVGAHDLSTEGDGDPKSSYKMEDMIGRGSQGEVWRAVRLNPDGSRTDNEFVLKRMFKASMPAGWREIYFGNKLRSTSDNVVRFVGHYAVIPEPPSSPQQELWLIFHHEGESLHRHLYSTQTGMLQPSSFWRTMKTDGAGPQLYRCMMRQLLEGVQATHQRNITHRDVKPSNVIIDVTHSPTRLKLADFGSAVDEHTLDNLYPPPGPSTNEETAQYAPPEVRLGLQAGIQRGPAYDVWSVGVLGLEMLLGMDPGRIFATTAREEAVIRSRLHSKDDMTVESAVYAAGLVKWGLLPSTPRTAGRGEPRQDQEKVADDEILAEEGGLGGQAQVRRRGSLGNGNDEEVVMVMGTPPVRPNEKSLLGEQDWRSWEDSNGIATFRKRLRELEAEAAAEQDLGPATHTLSDQGVSLLWGMMRFDPTDRPTVVEALRHMWFDDNEDDPF